MKLHNKIRVIFAATVLLLGLNFPLASVSAVSGQSAQGDVCTGIGEANGSGSSTCASQSGSGLNSLIGNVIQIISLIVGVAAIIMVIVGGFRYVISGGDSNATGAAKNTIIYALVGLVIAALAETLVRFVLFRATGIGK